MSVQLGPSGTRGMSIPAFVRPLMKVGMSLGHALFRWRGGRMKVLGQPLLLLTTIGAKTGRKRQTLLAYFPDLAIDGARLVIGSGGGSVRHPGWSHNLAKNPEQVSINLGNGELKVKAVSLTGPEREEAWKRVVLMAPSYGQYELKTDRQIPIIRLTRAG